MPTDIKLADIDAAATATFTLSRNPFGRLTLIHDDGTVYEGVVPVRAFPISAPQGGIGMMSADGHEVVWIPRLEALPAAERSMIEEELASREFMPEIERIVEVSTFATPSVWTVQTDRGRTSLVLRGEEAIRRLSGNTLMVSDSHGIHYLIRDLMALDKHSRKLLDRFL
ncbi:DUF1854 domain-containing protein [Cupriavidus oxalaticus]|uniref:DUF1854 domain-containing protein n=1 Tax=Cupriavidus oxalaticus TaxID=96344 RepID=A0A375GBP1_9BURK|nr:DUF1854 domain-containing protein [Cupriavidus oxalaticus]QEZ45889.1 DUF1854 domain-containing protein [Cupriavidus oxalaticus]QRQ86702.1 DUF1854 domain-containing protein [Cupriavidus oxalaticus]QRQ94970.1 DUF1854 domain-containing protein [Cupriavidus oxalaticus]WQD83625.1 DUF1854 domain-containing protein [Cupriavidus oxalaticus]SPC16883.1 conserved hypothetical protein [Cupriavidus oxalaticus]